MSTAPVSPVSKATVKPIPTVSPYDISELELFTRYTRASYKEEFGVDAPKFNPALTFLHNGKMVTAIKNWFDSDAIASHPTQYGTFLTVSQGLAGTSNATEQIALPPLIGPFIYLSAGLANVVNLPDDAPDYPDYEVEDTDAYENDDGKHLYINKYYLSTIQQAEELQQQIGTSANPVVEYQPTGGPGQLRYVYPADEGRRVWQFIDVLGQVQNVGLLLVQKNAFGVGAPGNWVNDGSGRLIWKMSIPTVDGSALKDTALVPMPLRTLEDTESFLEPSVAGGNPMIANSASLTTK